MKTKLYNRTSNRSLDEIAVNIALKSVRSFTYSNANEVLDELRRYRRIAKYFKETQKANKKGTEFIKLSIERRTEKNWKYLQLIVDRINSIYSSLSEKLTDEQRDAGFQTDGMKECQNTLNAVLIYCLPNYK